MENWEEESFSFSPFSEVEQYSMTMPNHRTWKLAVPLVFKNGVRSSMLTLFTPGSSFTWKLAVFYALMLQSSDSDKFLGKRIFIMCVSCLNSCMQRLQLPLFILEVIG